MGAFARHTLFRRLRHVWHVEGDGDDGHPGSGSVQVALRWHLANELWRLRHAYQTVIATRSDYYWVCPHPPLSGLPEPSAFMGNVDRHLAARGAGFAAFVLNATSALFADQHPCAREGPPHEALY
eukprot:gene50885-45803_t